MRADGRVRQLWGVLVPRELLLDPDIRAAAALLAAGPAAALTGLTAAWLQGCSAAATSAVHVAVPYSCSLRTQQGLVVHQGRRLLEEVIEVRGLRAVVLESRSLSCSARTWPGALSPSPIRQPRCFPRGNDRHFAAASPIDWPPGPTVGVQPARVGCSRW